MYIHYTYMFWAPHCSFTKLWLEQTKDISMPCPAGNNIHYRLPKWSCTRNTTWPQEIYEYFNHARCKLCTNSLVHTRNLLILKHNLFSMKVNTGHETSGQQSSQINYSIRQRQFRKGNYPCHYHVLMMCVNNSIYYMQWKVWRAASPRSYESTA